MNRRTFFEGLGRIALLAIPFSSRFGWAKALDGKADMPEDGLVLIYDSLNFNGYRTLLEKARLFTDSNEMPTLWDVQKDSPKVRAFIGRYGKNTKHFSWPTLFSVRRGESDVEFWNHEWLRARERKDPQVYYPISGNWWSVDGDFNPTLEKVVKHLDHSPNHEGGEFETWYLKRLEYGESMSLHSDHHREMKNMGKVHWDYVNIAKP